MNWFVRWIYLKSQAEKCENILLAIVTEAV